MLQPRTRTVLISAIVCIAALITRHVFGWEPWFSFSPEFDAGLAAATLVWGLVFAVSDLMGWPG